VLPIHAPAWMFVGTWIILQFINAASGETGHVAWFAHVGGILAGLALTPLFKRRGVRLFGPPPAPAPRLEQNEAPPPQE